MPSGPLFINSKAEPKNGDNEPFSDVIYIY